MVTWANFIWQQRLLAQLYQKRLIIKSLNHVVWSLLSYCRNIYQLEEHSRKLIIALLQILGTFYHEKLPFKNNTWVWEIKKELKLEIWNKNSEWWKYSASQVTEWREKESKCFSSDERSVTWHVCSVTLSTDAACSAFSRIFIFSVCITDQLQLKNIVKYILYGCTQDYSYSQPSLLQTPL